MKTHNRFVVFEGIDGSGKGTQIDLLKKHFRGRDDVVFTFEHTRKGEWSRKLEDILHGRVAAPPAKEIQMLFVLDRRDHLHKVIVPALTKGKTVFCDRYMLSTLAYGSLDPSLHWKTLLEMHREVIGDDFLLPQKTLFFDVPVEVALERIHSNRDDKTIFEAQEKLIRIRDSYLAIGPNFEGFEVVDGIGDPEIVFERFMGALQEFV